jgi:hypothetical protein
MCRRAAATAELVAVGLWEPTDGGYRVHDYLEYQPSAADLAAQSEKKSAAGKRGGQRSGETRRASSDAKQEPSKNEAPCLPSGSEESKPDPVPDPDPSRPDRIVVVSGARDVELSALAKRLESELGYKHGLIRAKWVPLAQQLAPFSAAEVDQAMAEARADGEPSAGLVIRIIERTRRTPVEKPLARSGPVRERSVFRDVTERALQEAREYDQRKLREAHDHAAGALPAKSG